MAHDNRSDNEVLAAKVALLLDVIRSPGGEIYTFREIEAGLRKYGVNLSRTRWQRLKVGSPDGRWDDELKQAFSRFFDIDPGYLMERSGDLPQRVAAELNLVRAMKLAEVETFAARTLGEVTPDALDELTAVLSKYRKN